MEKGERTPKMGRLWMLSEETEKAENGRPVRKRGLPLVFKLTELQKVYMLQRTY